MATVRIYKVAELLNTSSQEVLALLKRAHGIELKSASSTIEEVVARQFVERLARERSITLPGGDMFAEGPVSKPGAKKPAADCKEARAGKARRADARAAAARENLEARCACRGTNGPRRAGSGRGAASTGRRTGGSAGADRRSARLRGWPRFGGQARAGSCCRGTATCAARSRATGRGPARGRSTGRRCASSAIEAYACAGSHGAAEHQTENRRAERARHLGGAGDADSTGGFAPPTFGQGRASSADCAAASGNRKSREARWARRRARRHLDATGPAASVISADAAQRPARRTAPAADCTNPSSAEPARHASVRRRWSAATRRPTVYTSADAPRRRTPSRRRAARTAPATAGADAAAARHANHHVRRGHDGEGSLRQARAARKGRAQEAARQAADDDDQQHGRYGHRVDDRARVRRRAAAPHVRAGHARSGSGGREAGRHHHARARRHGHGARRPRQDDAARRDPHDARRRARSGRHYAAHRRVSRHDRRPAGTSCSSTRRATKRSR